MEYSRPLQFSISISIDIYIFRNFISSVYFKTKFLYTEIVFVSDNNIFLLT